MAAHLQECQVAMACPGAVVCQMRAGRMRAGQMRAGGTLIALHPTIHAVHEWIPDPKGHKRGETTYGRTGSYAHCHSRY